MTVSTLSLLFVCCGIISGQNIPPGSIFDATNPFSLFDFLTPQGPGVSETCASDGAYYIAALNLSNAFDYIGQGNWYLKMFDASAKLPPNGILQGTLDFPGSFSSCLEVDAMRFKGKHCLLSIGADITPRSTSETMRKLQIAEAKGNPSDQLMDIVKMGVRLRVGHCIPDSCSDQDLVTGFHNFITELENNTDHNSMINENMTISLNADVLNCHSLEETVEWNGGDWTMVAISIAFGLLLFIGTVIDLSVLIFKVDCFGEKTVQIFQGFSIYHNTIKIFNTDSSSGDTLSCINGIRFLSMSWVLIGHTYLEFMKGFFINNSFSLLDPNNPVNSVSFMPIQNGDYCVDTFFLIGAVLLSYLTLKQLEKANGASLKCGVIFYVHRYLRLTGVYSMVIGLYATLLKFMATGPNSSHLSDSSKFCQETWWKNLLYINIYSPVMGETCIDVSWYLSNEMHMFIISPLIIYPLWKREKLGVILGGLWLLGSTIGIIIAGILEEVDMSGGFPTGKTMGEDFYFKPWFRFQPYIVGLLLGYILFKLRNKSLKISNVTSLWIWGFAGLTGALVVYGPYDMLVKRSMEGGEITTAESIAFVGLMRLAWSLAVGWVILACVKGVGGPINTLLSWGFFAPLARLSYCMYLIHMPVLLWIVSLPSFTIAFTQSLALYCIIGVLMLTTAVAYVLVMVFEAPMMHLEKLLFAVLGLGNMPSVRKN